MPSAFCVLCDAGDFQQPVVAEFLLAAAGFGDPVGIEDTDVSLTELDRLLLMDSAKIASPLRPMPIPPGRT